MPQRYRLPPSAIGLVLFSMLISYSYPKESFAQTRDSHIKQSIVTAIVLKSGKQLSGELSGLDDQQVELMVDNQRSTFSIDEVQTISNAASGGFQTGVFVSLVDGSQIRVDQITMQNNLLLCQRDQSKFEIRTRDVFGVLIDAKSTVQLAEMVGSIESEGSSADALVALRNEKLQFIEGVARSINDKQVEFSVADRTANVRFEKLKAIAFFHSVPREFQTSLVRCIGVDGSVLHARSVQLKSSKQQAALQFNLLAGPVVELAWSSVAKIEFGQGSSVALSDLAPSTIDWKPLIASPAISEMLRRINLPRLNRSYQDSSLELSMPVDAERAKLKTFNRGIAMRSGGKLAYQLQKQYTRCVGWVGFAPEVKKGGNLLLKIAGDSKILVEQPMTLANYQGPIQVDVDLSEVSRLVITAEYHDGRSAGDQIHLVDLTLTRKDGDK